MVCKINFVKRKIKNREYSNAVFFTDLSVCLCIWISFHWLWKTQADWTKFMALSFQKYDWLREIKQGSSFPPHENNPVFQDKATAVFGCLHEKPQVMSSSRRPRLCTEYYRKAKTSSSNPPRYNSSKSVPGISSARLAGVQQRQCLL